MSNSALFSENPVGSTSSRADTSRSNQRFSKHRQEFARKRTQIKTIQKKIRIYIESRTWKAAIVQSEFSEAVDGCSFTCPAFQWLSSFLRLYCLLRFISLSCVHPCAGTGGNYAYFESRHEIMPSEESLRLTHFSKGAFDAIAAKEHLRGHDRLVDAEAVVSAPHKPRARARARGKEGFRHSGDTRTRV